MKVLVVGSGGREHALAWKLRQSPLLTELYCAPGNPGTAAIADNVPIAVDEIHQLADFAKDLSIDLVVVGPELPLSLGLVDELIARGVPVFGPRQAAAELEASKVFSKLFMQRHGIPTARAEVVDSREGALAAVASIGMPVVLKADGLAAGKGVILCHDQEALEEGLGAFFDERRFGTSGDRVVVEELLDGEEISFMVLCDGARVLPLASARDYKRLGDGDTGPNTGGMGAHSPAGSLDKELATVILDHVITPTIAGMAAENRELRGVLYAGLMLTEDGPKVLEFNTRLGDPEAEAILLRLEGDLLPVLASGAAGSFEGSRLHFKKEVAACIVLASDGYPMRPQRGDVISGLEDAAALEGVQVFHSGTALGAQGEVVASGGRVLAVCATGADLRESLRRAYQASSLINWPAKIFRRDIGRAALGRAAG
jgi:phosphoribosylamine--glycine ligase